MSIDLDAIRARADAATPGPWTYAGRCLEEGWEYEEVLGGGTPGSAAEHHVAAMTCFTNPSAAQDADFIAHAREDVPALIEEVCRLRDQREDYILAWPGNARRA